ncbi:TPA: hypothetical protein DIV55_06145 [Patescibacteria group bacterium]|uniref:HYDIN/VesB/CFA65-like Ig-like domain-containing protein n=1 Tax=Candidatus Gottesmanbacteria bacterium GW2011_GWA1_43_11 TaxID=1618436 RepID=A0A0G1CJU3_9BACT|nr:MAG: hypothetical protein UV59_C0005G0010 [Candidatus Gottesmanbacteria bacterium GW2011_GWA1_43_11]HCS79287.1 hypothetical protein [Patescibacteria group bacterium]
MNEYSSSNSTDKTVFWIIGGISLIVLMIIAFVAFGESKNQTQVASYEATATSRPQASVATTTADFGKMKVTDEQTAEFTIENTGNKPLQLFKVTSSCGCTFGTIIINGKKSPEFSMHSKSNWTGSLTPGEKALVAVTYKPNIMPVKGDITRAVYVSTNDPNNKQLTFSIKAFVE